MSDIREIPQAYSISTIRAHGTEATHQRSPRRQPREAKEERKRKERTEPFEDGHQLDEYI